MFKTVQFLTYECSKTDTSYQKYRFDEKIVIPLGID